MALQTRDHYSASSENLVMPRVFSIWKTLGMAKLPEAITVITGLWDAAEIRLTCRLLHRSHLPAMEASIKPTNRYGSTIPPAATKRSHSRTFPRIDPCHDTSLLVHANLFCAWLHCGGPTCTVRPSSCQKCFVNLWMQVEVSADCLMPHRP